MISLVFLSFFGIIFIIFIFFFLFIFVAFIKLRFFCVSINLFVSSFLLFFSGGKDIAVLIILFLLPYGLSILIVLSFSLFVFITLFLLLVELILFFKIFGIIFFESLIIVELLLLCKLDFLRESLMTNSFWFIEGSISIVDFILFCKIFCNLFLVGFILVILISLLLLLLLSLSINTILLSSLFLFWIIFFGS